MEADNTAIKITKQQTRFLKLLYKFRFINAPLLGQVLGIRSDTTYKVLESLVKLKLVTKVYEKAYRIERKPAYYYLNKKGVTAVRAILDVKESVIHALYGNDTASKEFIEHCQVVLAYYAVLKPTLPKDTDIFTKSEINRFSQFPKNRPDLYIRTPDNKEVIVVVAENSPLYIINKRLEEIITHSEDEGWEGDYPVIAFVLKDKQSQNSFLYKAHKKLEAMGMEEDELTILATSIHKLADGYAPWYNAFSPQQATDLF